MTCNGTEVLLRDCLRGQYNISNTLSAAMVAGLSCSTLILIQYTLTDNVLLSAVDKNDSTKKGNTSVLEAITGILVVDLIALVAVVTAWIISCVYAKRFV